MVGDGGGEVVPTVVDVGSKGWGDVVRLELEGYWNVCQVVVMLVMR